MQVPMPDFARHLKEWRIKASITQSDMATKLNMTQSHVSKYETGRKIIDLETFYQWVRVTNAEANAAILVFGTDIFVNASQALTLVPALISFIL